jgi:hypothetical protein
MLGGLVILGLRVLTVCNDWDLPYEYAILFAGMTTWILGTVSFNVGLRRFRMEVVLDRSLSPASRVQLTVLAALLVAWLALIGLYCWSLSETPVSKPNRLPGELGMLFCLFVISSFSIYHWVRLTRQPPPVDDSPERV